jgi:hypothetical protein
VNDTEFTPTELAAMRQWIADRSWSDLAGDDVADLPDEIVVWGIDNHYDGGVEAFLRDLHR